MATTYTDNAIAAPALYVNIGTQSSPTLVPVGSSGFVVLTTTASLLANIDYACNTTSAAFTVTLPAAPTLGDLIVIADAQQFWATNNLTVNPNGNKINTSASNLVLSSPAYLRFIWVAGAQGWSKF